MNPLKILAVLLGLMAVADAQRALVFQSDFGRKDGAVSAMHGVAFGVSPRLAIFDLSHENTPFDVWEAAYRLKQTAGYWPKGTVFVSVVDPGVGKNRKSVVVQTKSGHFFVGPDNGSFALIAEDLGVAAVREIDPSKHRLAGSDKSYTFHGRDVFAFVGARLAAEAVPFAEVGPELSARVVALAYERARLEGETLVGTIPALDAQYGNVWTNLDEALFAKLAPKVGDRFQVSILRAGEVIYTGELPYVASFGEVALGTPLLYLNSLLNVSFALNRGDFAQTNKVGRGAEWGVRIKKINSGAPAVAK
jgi:S-adenosylmethionine hydrolase